MFPHDYHLHCNFSCDSKASIVEQCLGAIQKGLPEIGVTDHFDLHPGDECAGFFRPIEWAAELDRARREFEGRLVIRAGIELGEPHIYQAECQAMLASYPFDYALGSLHWVGDEIIFDRQYFRRPADEAYGLFFEELERMTDWMRDHFKPDVVHLSNALLLGLAKTLKEKLQVPVICTLQDEDVWVDVMSDQSRKTVWKLMEENSTYVDRFISVSQYFAGVASQKMSIPAEKITSIHIGVDPADYQYMNSAEKKRTIGYISRMCHENGMDILVDAFILLKKQPGYEDVQLILTGGQTGDDKQFLKEVHKKIKKNGLTSSIDFHKNFEGEGRNEFF
ncbi:MAG: glycosyltransferase, partial [Chloroflexi bacterium]|nr:glycosyltransferase [Chloroflexota bacterium]